MSKLVTFSIAFLFIITSIFSQSQTCDCQTDLDFVVEKIKKMPSYKKQIKGEKETQFKNLYATLSSKMQQPILVEDCYKLLLEQMSLVNDVHAFAGHIACDAASNSEIVVPIIKNGKIFAVLDIDSPSLSRFDEQDKAGLETLIRQFETQV